MANYKTHVTFNLLLMLPLATTGVCYISAPPVTYLITFILAFAYGTCFMNPDLDLIHKIKLFSLRGLLTLPFRFYSKIFKHRGISHSFFFGTATRILWLSALAFLLFYLAFHTFPTKNQFMFHFNAHKFYFFYGLAGLVFADWCHLALDFYKKF